MFLLNWKIRNCAKHKFTVLILKNNFAKFSTRADVQDRSQSNPNTCEKAHSLEELAAKYLDKLLYSSVFETKKIGPRYQYKVSRKNKLLRDTLANVQPLPFSLKYISNDLELINEGKTEHLEESSKSEQVVQFPFHSSVSGNVVNEKDIVDTEPVEAKTPSISEEIQLRNKLYKDTGNWMTAYDNFENDLIQNEEDTDEINYGTPDPNSEISKVPCGGCGALLHCKDTGIPGYIPSEIFKNVSRKGGSSLQEITCQRCYFLKEYNLALQVSISPDEYPKILSIIRNKQALVVLMVDLMDFPCSIWPGIADILGPKTPIVVVGNKVDLLPRDGKKFLSRVEQNLLDHIRLSGFATSNILNVSLISAKSGFGVEALITRLHSLWKHKGDVYLVGCTNVGKSSLFNALLQSDYCKIQASDLIQRATISHWPGTTLNMLKFPIMRPTGQRLYWRHKRLMEEQRFAAKEAKLRTEVLKTDNVAAHATLIGRIGQTYSRDNDTDVEVKDCFLMSTKTNDPGNVRMGIDENHPEYALSRWCFDTPGVVQPNQILHLLTIEELMHTIPKEIIRPQTFCVKPGTSLFIAGLARLDFLKGPGSVRLTVFRSNALPVTLCHLEVADSIYEECLGTELFKVPVPSAIRLSKWPGLESTKPFVVTGAGRRTSCNDVVLSSAGWVAITPLKVGDFEFQAWTPEKRGIYIRDSLLPEAVTLKGPRISRSVAYKYNKFI